MRMYAVFTAAFVAALVAGCHETPTNPNGAQDRDLLTNGAILPNDNLIAHPDAPNLEDSSMAPPWYPATGSPQLCCWKGNDGAPGYFQMWGSADHGEGVFQMLRTPIRKGRQYRVELDAAWMPQDPLNRIHHVIVRFLAFNTLPTGDGEFWWHWEPQPGNVAVIGSITTADSTWQHFSAPVWTADADYSGFEMNAENEVLQNNSPYNHSWAVCDNVKLLELGGDQ